MNAGDDAGSDPSPSDPTSSDGQKSDQRWVEIDLVRTIALVDACVSLIRVDGAAVTLMADDGARELVYATNAVAQQLDELQFTIGEGPCVDAYVAGAPVQYGDLADEQGDQRWPGFSGEATRTGARAVFAFPLRGGGTPFGLLELYRTRPGLLADEEFTAALATADAAAVAVLDELAPPAEDDGRERRMTGFSRPEVNQAAGMIAIQLEIPVEEALARLRASAFSQQRSVSSVARDVVNRKIRFDSVPFDNHDTEQPESGGGTGERD